MFRNQFEGFVRRFLLTYGFTMLATLFFCVVFQLGETLEVAFLGQAILFSICANLVSLVYFSRHELSEKEWLFRTEIHTILLEIVLLTFGHWCNMWNGLVQGIVFFVVVLLVDAGVSLLEYGQNVAMARDVNLRLKERREQNSVNIEN